MNNLEKQISKIRDWASTNRVSPLTERDFGKIEMAREALKIIEQLLPEKESGNPDQCDKCLQIKGEDHNDDMITGHDKVRYCHSCFTEKFMHEECGGFSNKFAAAVYDGSFCECD